MSEFEEPVEDIPVDPYEGEGFDVTDAGDPAPPGTLIGDDTDADTSDAVDASPGDLAAEPTPDPGEEDLSPVPDEWSELDPEALDLPDADESEATIADEVDALDDYDELEIEPEEDLPDPVVTRWDAYEVQAREANTIADFFQIALVDDPTATSVAVTTLEPGKTYEIRVRGIKADGTSSTWSDIETVVLPVDQIPPPQPSAPVVVGVPGGFVISHDGLTATGGAQPTDYAHTVLWAKRGATGTPMVVDRFTGPFNVTYTEMQQGLMTWWVTTADRAGNSSIQSAEVSGEPQALVDEAGLRDKLERLSTGEDLVADSVAAYIGEFLHLEAAQLNANEIWSNAAWLGQAKFESEVSGNRVLIDPTGVKVGSTTTPAGLEIARTGLTTKDDSGKTTFSLSGTNGSVSMEDATITAGQYRTATSGRRVLINTDGLRAYDDAGTLQIRVGAATDANGLAIRAPGGNMREIGPHIFGTEHITSFPDSWRTVDDGTSTGYGAFYVNTRPVNLTCVSDRYRIDLTYFFKNDLPINQSTAAIDWWLRPTDTDQNLLGGTLLRKEVDRGNSVARHPDSHTLTDIADMSTVPLGDRFRIRYQVRVRGLGGAMFTGLNIVATPI